MTLVVDAGAVIAALVNTGPEGRWAESVLAHQTLTAPHLMPVEAANILRRAVLSGTLSADLGAMAHDDLVQLRVDLFPYEPFAERIWQLGSNLTCYDAWSVALAESLGVPLVTLDRRLAHTSGPTCSFQTPP